MTLNKLKEQINSGCFDKDFQLLYSETKNSANRYSEACDKFADLYGENREDVRLFSAPGRTEVGGNHTDHQHGCVLAGSVNLDVIAVVAPNNDNVVRIKSEGYPLDEIDLNVLEVQNDETGKAASLIRGMCAIMKDNGYVVSGFDAYTTSNVLKGSGLSSSAAFEVLIGKIISGLFNNDVVDAVSIAKFAQKAENVYFGKPCGLMDQTASSVGGFTAIDFKDTANPVIKKVEFNIADEGHSLCIVNTGGDHADLTDDYADITVGDRKVAEFFGKDFLRDVDPQAFYSKIGEVRAACGDRATLCAFHFFNDNQRAIDEAEALSKGDFKEFLRLINESGNSSFKYLQNVFSSRFPNSQGLSVALALTEKYIGNRGACRVHGGGFAGTIQAFIPNDMLDGYKEMIENVFGKGSCYILNIRPVGGYAF